MKKKQLKKLLPYILAALVILPILVSILFDNFRISAILQEKPTDTIVTNISSTSVQIYSKAPQENIYRIYYKKATDSGLYKETEDIQILHDNISDKNVYFTKIDELEPNSEYLFKIQSRNHEWENFSFKTKSIAEEIALPSIQTGTNDTSSFLLLTSEEENIMVDTQYHGTWAFDSKGKEFTVRKYLNYLTSSELQTKLRTLLGSPVYADSGANCKTGIEMDESTTFPRKATVVRIIHDWVGDCAQGGYANECFEDVYCRASSYEANPGFVFAIWSNESGGSNYAYSSKVEDFGIHSTTLPSRNFDLQIEHFLNTQLKNGGSDYISGCNKGLGYDELSQWGARFLRGNCQTAENLEAGKAYITGIGQIYNWYTNKTLTWPLSADTGIYCDYSQAYTNTSYNSCSTQGTPTTPPTTTPGTTTPPTTPGTTTPPTTTPGTTTPSTETPTPTQNPDNDVDDMLILNENRYCTDPDGCQCIYNNYKTILQASFGYYCTPDKKVLKTEKLCCEYNNSLSFIWPYDCKGTIRSNITKESCGITVNELKIEKGVNFFEAVNIINKETFPIDTAKGFISYTKNKVLAIGMLRNDIWEKIVKYENGIINGNDFNLEPGETYLIISTDAITIPAKGYLSSLKTDLQSLKGWNLVSSSNLTATSDSSKSILQNTSFTYINQMAQWQKKNGLLKYTVRELDNTIYGEEFKLSDSKGVFVRISQ